MKPILFIIILNNNISIKTFIHLENLKTMKRIEFFSAFGITAGMLFMAPVLSSCSKSMTDSSNTNGTGGNNGPVDFTLDLSTPSYAMLNNSGGSVVVNSIIVARTSSGMLVALSAVCTHQGGPIGFENAANQFHCPNHGSNFGLDGSVINGPAAAPLKKYNLQLTGTSLRVYA